MKKNFYRPTIDGTVFSAGPGQAITSVRDLPRSLAGGVLVVGREVFLTAEVERAIGLAGAGRAAGSYSTDTFKVGRTTLHNLTEEGVQAALNASSYPRRTAREQAVADRNLEVIAWLDGLRRGE